MNEKVIEKLLIILFLICVELITIKQKKKIQKGKNGVIIKI